MANIRDVARRAGVAPSTVSYALSGKRPISEAARARIAQAITDLDFTPSALGRSLAHSRSNMIGLVYPVPEAELTWETLGFVPSAAAALDKRGYGLSVFTGPMTRQHILKLHRQNTVDGFILMQVTHHDERIEALRDTDCPLVLIGRCENIKGLTWVDFDPEQATYLIFEHLVKLGHRHIGYLDIPKQKYQEKLGYARFVQRGHKRACKDLDMVTHSEGIDGTIDDGLRATLCLLKKEPRITAFVTVYGNTAFGALRALHQQGRRVPQDCSLISISRSNWSLTSNPQLTSTDIPLNDMVQTGTELILQQLAGQREPRQVLFPAQVVVRESTGPVRILGRGRGRTQAV